MIHNKIVLPLLMVCLCSIIGNSEGNEFKEWTKNGKDYQDWTKEGVEYNKWTYGEYGYQNNPYANAYNLGYQEAFREDNGMPSIVPLPKTAKMSKTGLSRIQDWFNRGFYDYYMEHKKRPFNLK